MTYEEAKQILDPQTSADAISKIEYYNGFNGKAAKIQAINEACILACEAMDIIIKEKGEKL